MTTTPEFKQIPVGDLQFDTSNPRLPVKSDSLEEAAILEFMLEDAGLADLMRSIGVQGFFPGEPILVCPLEKEAGRYLVVEGNRRLAAVKLLNDPTLAPNRTKTVHRIVDESDEIPNELPCLVFPDRQSIIVHLGYRHVTGIKEWSPLAKAIYLQQRMDAMPQGGDDNLKDLARSIGSRADYVGRLLTSLALYRLAESEGWIPDAELEGDKFEFSLLSSALGYVPIVEYLGLINGQDWNLDGLDTGHFEDIFTWVFLRNADGRTVLGESRNFRLLARVLQDDDATESLREGESLEAAYEMATGAEDALYRVSSVRRGIQQVAHDIEDFGSDLLSDAYVNEIDSINDVAVRVFHAVHHEEIQRQREEADN